MIYINKLVYIAISTAVFGFLFAVGNDVRQGGDYSRTGTAGIVRLAGRVVEGASAALGHDVVGYAIMALALIGGTFAAVLIWRDDMIF